MFKEMTMIASDYTEITQFVIEELRKRSIDLNEGARGMLIGKALKAFREQGLRIMREVVLWEISFLAPVNMPRGNDRAVTIAKIDKLKQSDKVKEYLANIGCHFFRTNKEYYTVIPKAYCMADVQKRLRIIQG